MIFDAGKLHSLLAHLHNLAHFHIEVTTEKTLYLVRLTSASFPEEVTLFEEEEEDDGEDHASLHRFSTNDVIFDTLFAVLLII